MTAKIEEPFVKLRFELDTDAHFMRLVNAIGRSADTLHAFLPGLFAESFTDGSAERVGSFKEDGSLDTAIWIRRLADVFSRSVLEAIAIRGLWLVWRHVYAQRCGEVLDDMFIFDIDDIAECPGFGEAMEQADWLVSKPPQLIFPGLAAFFRTQFGPMTNSERCKLYRERLKQLPQSDITAQPLDVTQIEAQHESASRDAQNDALGASQRVGDKQLDCNTTDALSASNDAPTVSTDAQNDALGASQRVGSRVARRATDALEENRIIPKPKQRSVDFEESESLESSEKSTQPAEPPQTTNTSKKAKKFQPEDVILPEELNTDEFKHWWREWCADRLARRLNLTERAVRLQLEDCVKWGPDRACIAIRKAIAGGWQGLFEPREENHGRNGTRSGGRLRTQPGEYTHLDRHNVPPTPTPSEQALPVPPEDEVPF